MKHFIFALSLIPDFLFSFVFDLFKLNREQTDTKFVGLLFFRPLHLFDIPFANTKVLNNRTSVTQNE